MKNLIAAIEEQERLAAGSGALAEARREALDHYLGKPYGDEEEGRSQIVMRDVADTVEWIKPSLLKIFCSGDEVAAFDPVGPEDEPAAEQETDYVNHVLMRKNDGFVIFHDWFHDALIQRNGYVWVKAVKESKQNREPYQNLSDEELAMLAQDPEVEVLEHTARTDEMGMPRHDVVLGKRSEYACIKVANVPPERVAVSADWPSLNFDGCPFLRIIDYPTISDLRAQGYDVPDNISDTASNGDEDYIEQARDIDGDDDDLNEQSADPSTRRVKTRYVWMLYDSDGDGQAELHFVVVVGTTILDDTQEDLIPVASLTPARMPHEHDGMSVDDIVSDLQRIRTVLVRGFLDNMYLANNGRYVVDADRVNLDDMLTARPGGVVRAKGGTVGAVEPLVHPQIGSDVMQAVEYVDSVRENRTGVTRYNQGLDANSLNKTATGVNSIMNAAQQRIELIARLFAETGVKSLMLIVHAMASKYSQRDEMIKLRGQWVPISPRAWKSRTDMSISVGLGTGNKDQILQHLTMLWQMQTAGLQFGIAKPEGLYETAKRLTNNIGMKQAEMFWSDPRQNPPQPPAPDPAIQVEQMKQQGAANLKQMELQDSAHKFQAEQQTQMAIDQNRQEWEARQKQLELQQQAQLEQIRQDGMERIRAAELAFERWKVEFTEANKARIAQMGNAVQMQQHHDSMKQHAHDSARDQFNRNQDREAQGTDADR
jgi:hypothetical protein